MKYTVKANEVKSKEGSIRGFATLVFGDAFKITNIAIMENESTGQLFVAMPRFRTNEKDENGKVIYKDVCNPITREFRDELYVKILREFDLARRGVESKEVEGKDQSLKFKVAVTPYEREGSHIRGLARIYFNDVFIVNNINILQGKKDLFVAMPSYRTNKTDEQGKDVYQDVCYPVTKEFRDQLCTAIMGSYQKEKDKKIESQSQGMNNQSRKEEVPFR